MFEVYVHVPAVLFTERVDFLLTRKLQPEVACQDTNIFRIDIEQFADSAARLTEVGLKTVLHAPFVDFLPGATDFRGRQRTIKLLEQTLILAERINAGKIVFHPGLSANATERETEDWLVHAYNLWSNYVAWAKLNNCIFCIENIYETSPAPLLNLITAIDSPYFGHVFDIGHWNIFSSLPLVTWLETMAPYIRHLHLHDNHGRMDEHLAIGTGTVPFDQFFTWLDPSVSLPSITLENHNLQALDQSLIVLSQTTRGHHCQ